VFKKSINKTSMELNSFSCIIKKFPSIPSLNFVYNFLLEAQNLKRIFRGEIYLDLPIFHSSKFFGKSYSTMPKWISDLYIPHGLFYLLTSYVHIMSFSYHLKLQGKLKLIIINVLFYFIFDTSKGNFIAIENAFECFIWWHDVVGSWTS